MGTQGTLIEDLNDNHNDSFSTFTDTSIDMNDNFTMIEKISNKNNNQQSVNDNTNNNDTKYKYDPNIDIIPPQVKYIQKPRNIVNNSTNYPIDYQTNNLVNTYRENPKINKQKHEKKNNENIYFIIQEIVLLVIVYVFVSQPFVISFFGQFLKMILADDTGKVSMTGIATYGLILASIFVLLREYLLVNGISFLK